MVPYVCTVPIAPSVLDLLAWTWLACRSFVWFSFSNGLVLGGFLVSNQAKCVFLQSYVCLLILVFAFAGAFGPFPVGLIRQEWVKALTQVNIPRAFKIDCRGVGGISSPKATQEKKTYKTIRRNAQQTQHHILKPI